MLKQLLERFFSKQDPLDTIQKRLNEHWSEWLKPIQAEKPVGNDLTYHDTFQDIKEEVAKLSGINYEFIAYESEKILKKESKDIRVASYYCLARLQLDGAEGFADGVELLAGLLDKFSKMLYPSRENVRKNAIEWLANTRFIEPLNKLQPIPEESLKRIIAALNLVLKANQTLFTSDNPNQPAALPDLDGLLRFFSSSLEQPVKVHATEQSKAELGDSSSPTSAVTGENKPLIDSAVRSQRDLLEQARKMAAFLREKPEGYLAAGRFLRALRWDTIHQLPLADHRGRTRLVAPRAELQQHISRLQIQGQWFEVFERAEVAFMEGANHFWLDLQRAAVTALQKMGEPYKCWADSYLTDVGLMLERLPGVERLSFDNGTPFADEETLHWINITAKIHHINGDEGLMPITITEGDENDWREVEKQALELAEIESLEKAFQWLQTLPMLHQAKQRYLLHFVQARVAEKIGQTEIAIKLLTALNNKQKQLTLSDWEPDLLFDVKSQLNRLLKGKSQLKESNKSQLMEQIERLHYELIELDPIRALALES